MHFNVCDLLWICSGQFQAILLTIFPVPGKQPWGRWTNESLNLSWPSDAIAATWVCVNIDARITMTSWWARWCQITSLMIVYSTVYSRHRSSKTSKLRVTAQRASSAENVSIWWRHHGIVAFCLAAPSNPPVSNFRRSAYELNLLHVFGG